MKGTSRKSDQSHPVHQLVAVQEHPLDDHDGIDWRFLDRFVYGRVGAVVEHPTPDPAITTRTEGFQHVTEEGAQVVGVAKVPLRRVPPQPVPDLPWRQEVILVHDDRRPAGPLDRGREPPRERRLPRTINAVDRDRRGTAKRHDVSGKVAGEMQAASIGACGHQEIIPARHSPARNRRACAGAGRSGGDVTH